MKLIPLWTKSFLEEKKLAFYYKEQAESSNDLAKAKAFQTSVNPTLFLVSHQSQGRGSQGRKWQNSDLMLSFLWHKEGGLQNLKNHSCEDFAQDVKQALEKTWSALDVCFKAPNDLYLQDKKLAGLLMEVLSQGSQTALILGLGLNVFSSPQNLLASCLKDKTKNLSESSWQAFLSHLIHSWSKRFKPL